MTPLPLSPPAAAAAEAVEEDEEDKAQAIFPASSISSFINRDEAVVATQGDCIEVVAVLPPLVTEDPIRVV